MSDWSLRENKVVVIAYFEMLRKQQAGHKFIKAEYRRRVEAATGRSKGSVEYKLQNISAILNEMGLMFLQGYAPFSNYQQSLKKVVVEHLNSLL